MAIRKQAGFTLVELVIVMAISAALGTIAFIGQAALRQQAQFDGAVEKVVASLADAHNEATAGVNTAGPGNGTRNCAGVAASGYVFAGVKWSATDTAAGPVIQLDYYAAARPGTACIFSTQVISGLPTDMRVDFPPAGNIRQILFVRDNLGGLNICHDLSTLASAAASFASGTCAAPATTGGLTIKLSDSVHTSQIEIDGSGLARRVN